jgi:hypothetical protein
MHLSKIISQVQNYIKGSPVHVASACAGSNHFGFYVRRLSLYFCNRLFLGLEPMTSRSQVQNYIITQKEVQNSNPCSMNSHPFLHIWLSQGVKLELCTNDRVGLLSEVTRIFRENSLAVTRAEVRTRGRMAANTFYVRGSTGEAVDQKTIDSIRQAVGQNIQVKGQPEPPEPEKESPTWFLFANLFRPRSLYSFGLFS